MLDFVNFILRCMTAYPNGMGGDDSYAHIEGHKKYQDYLHPNNPYCDGEATPKIMEVFYYDKNGTKLDVEFG